MTRRFASPFGQKIRAFFLGGIVGLVAALLAWPITSGLFIITKIRVVVIFSVAVGSFIAGWYQYNAGKHPIVDALIYNPFACVFSARLLVEHTIGLTPSTIGIPGGGVNSPYSLTISTLTFQYPRLLLPMFIVTVCTSGICSLAGILLWRRHKGIMH